MAANRNDIVERGQKYVDTGVKIKWKWEWCYRTHDSRQINILMPHQVTYQMNNQEHEEIAARIGSELKRMQRRKQLFYPASPPLSSYSSSSLLYTKLDPVSIASPSSLDLTSSQLSPSGSSSPKQKDVPLFTFKQVAMICERMVQDHEEKIRENYDKVLNDKLSEQYEAFLKFNHDQLHKRFGNAPMSYVS